MYVKKVISLFTCFSTTHKSYVFVNCQDTTTFIWYIAQLIVHR